MKINKDVALSVLLMAGINISHAAELTAPESQAQRNIDQLQRGEEKKFIESEIQRERKVQEGEGNSQNVTDDKGVISTHLFTIDEIVVTGDERYEFSPERNAIIEPWLHTKMGQAEVLSLVKDLTNFYVSKGYVTTQVTITPGSLRTKKLVLKVLWGKLLGFSHNNEEPGWRENMRLFSAMPFSAGKIVNISDIDQALDNLLRVSSKDKMDIVPTEITGFSRINHQSQWIFPLSFHAGVNNSGYRDSGWYQKYLSASLKNILGMNDTFNYYFARNDLDAKTDSQSSKSFSFNFPLGYWLFDTNYYHSEYMKVIGGNFGGYMSEGNSQRLSLKTSRTILRNATGKTSAYLKVEKKKNENAIFGFPIAVSSKDYTSINAGLNWVGSLLGGWSYMDMSMTAGVPWFNSSWTNDPDLRGFDINYKKYNGTLTWNRRLASTESGRFAVEYELNSGFQFSNDSLVSDVKYNIGDEYTVRGYKESSVAAERAVYLSSTMKFPVQIQFARVYQISPFAGFDMGMAQKNCPGGVNVCDRDYMSGAAAGIKMSGKDFSSSFTTGWPVKKPTSLKETRVDNYTLYFNVDVGF
ncbi:ShlB/FhaC/HecB family hemolysin secretion/activation protein [Erwinia sp. ErVv1]|uniref:ShlB/FhaC/HecB family hemolysin secretion/activation protein n=1 Tax=Erwinia sp. ErVv1 TaxID=1603299 RepID=UPI000835B100|nr:ShlB/FhaC/HecB family hemolysin secretion/activation protein [Erwinia sp. ErVv1]